MKLRHLSFNNLEVPQGFRFLEELLSVYLQAEKVDFVCLGTEDDYNLHIHTQHTYIYEEKESFNRLRYQNLSRKLQSLDQNYQLQPSLQLLENE